MYRLEILEYVLDQLHLFLDKFKNTSIGMILAFFLEFLFLGIIIILILVWSGISTKLPKTLQSFLIIFTQRSHQTSSFLLWLRHSRRSVGRPVAPNRLGFIGLGWKREILEYVTVVKDNLFAFLESVFSVEAKAKFFQDIFGANNRIPLLWRMGWVFRILSNLPLSLATVHDFSMEF